MNKQPFWVVLAKCDNYNNGWRTWVVCVQTQREDADRVVKALRAQAKLWIKRIDPIRRKRTEQHALWAKTYPTYPPGPYNPRPSADYGMVSPAVTFGTFGTVTSSVMYMSSGPGFGTSMVISGALPSSLGGSTQRSPEIDREAQTAYKRHDEEELAAYRALVESLGMMDRRFNWADRDSLDVPVYEVVETSDDPHTFPPDDSAVGHHYLED